MNIKGFFGCCGANIIMGFGGYSGEPPDVSPAVTKKKLLRYITDYKRLAFLILILNEYQMEFFGEIVLECGFKAVATGKNRGDEGNILTTFIYSNE